MFNVHMCIKYSHVIYMHDTFQTEMWINQLISYVENEVGYYAHWPVFFLINYFFLNALLLIEKESK